MGCTFIFCFSKEEISELNSSRRSSAKIVHIMRIENKTETSNFLSTIKASKEQGNKGGAGPGVSGNHIWEFGTGNGNG